MNNKLLTIWLVIFLFGLLACNNPNEQIKDINGKPIDSQGKWLVINYWATWCKPCIEELPELNKIDKKTFIRVIGINYDQLANEELRKAALSLGIEFTLTVDALHTMYGYELPKALPMTVILSPDRTKKTIFHGPQNESTLLAAIQNNDLMPSPSTIENDIH